VSLLAGIMVLCTVFATMPEAATTIVGAGNEGLTFIWVPQLFGQIPAGGAFMVFFFLALFFAAWSSLIAMIELATRVLMDAGLSRGRAIPLVGIAGFLFGLPSARSLPFFQNQDWVWGVGLMLSGFFFAWCVVKYGADRFRTAFINQPGSDITIGRWWNWAMRLVLLEAVVLLIWWLKEAVQGGDLAATLTPFSSFNVGTVLFQFAVVLVALVLLNRFIAARMSGDGELPESEPA
jgi:NSS family neurotransmitter:Na+ symporter